MLKLLLDCMSISCSRFATLVATDLRRAFGERMRKRACVRVPWVACMREFAGDSGATGVRHCAEFILFAIHTWNTSEYKARFRVSYVSRVSCVSCSFRLCGAPNTLGHLSWLCHRLHCILWHRSHCLLGLLGLLVCSRLSMSWVRGLKVKLAFCAHTDCRTRDARTCGPIHVKVIHHVCK